MLERLDQRGLVPLLLLSQGLVVLPHLLRLPLWFAGLGLGALFWRYWAHVRKVALPGRMLSALITLSSLAGVYYEFRAVSGREAGVALLVVMTCLKVLELKARRDALILIYLGYFLVGTNFLFSQAIPMALYLLGAVWVNTLALVALNRLDGLAKPRQAMVTTSRLVALTLPTMLLLFVLFPRLPGPLWRMPDAPGRGTTGMSDSMSPGEINALATDDAVAFRVRFDGEIPAKPRLYWRGLVFDHYDGLTWVGNPSPPRQPAPVVSEGERVRYSVALPSGRYRWLYSLDIPAAGPQDTPLRRDHVLMLERPINDARSYRLTSYGQYRFGIALSAFDRSRNLQLPARDGNERSRAWARNEREQAGSDAAYVDRVLRFIHEQPFYYTLTPPILREEQIDDFWFDQRRGFCEHYAGSFVYLMRAAGIPARVVVGYQGGEVNPYGHYLIVRQADAHAWTEVWLAGEGWRRIDPTAAIAPARVESRLNLRFAGVDPLFDTNVFDGPAATSLWQEIGLYWDSVNSAWNTWVVDFDQERQGDFFSAFGLPRFGAAELGYFLAALLAAALAIGSVLLLREQDRPDTIARTYLRLEQRLAKLGLHRAPEESPTAFLARAARSQPRLAAELTAIAQLYAALRYRNSRKPLLLGRELRTRVARLGAKTR